MSLKKLNRWWISPYLLNVIKQKGFEVDQHFWIKEFPHMHFECWKTEHQRKNVKITILFFQFYLMDE